MEWPDLWSLVWAVKWFIRLKLGLFLTSNLCFVVGEKLTIQNAVKHRLYKYCVGIYEPFEIMARKLNNYCFKYHWRVGNFVECVTLLTRNAKLICRALLTSVQLAHVALLPCMLPRALWLMWFSFCFSSYVSLLWHRWCPANPIWLVRMPNFAHLYPLVRKGRALRLSELAKVGFYQNNSLNQLAFLVLTSKSSKFKSQICQICMWTW